MMQKFPRFVAGWGVEASHAKISLSGSMSCHSVHAQSMDSPRGHEGASSRHGRLSQCVDELLLGRSCGLYH